jgi:four helix bundle protein
MPESSKFKYQSSNQVQSSKAQRTYDLVERTAKLGEEAVRFANRLPRTPVSVSLIGQFVRSATSIGANCMEADGAESRKDFGRKIAISRKEAKETTHWLRMIAACGSADTAECRRLWREAHELTLILFATLKKLKE